MKSSMPVSILKAHVLRFRIKFHIFNSIDIYLLVVVLFTNQEKVNYDANESLILEKLNKNHEFIKH